MQTVIGSMFGGVGNFAAESLAAPLVNRIPRQYTAVDVRAVVPDEMVKLMNDKKPGSGTELREAAAAEQRMNANLDSPRNVRVGQLFFDGMNAARVFAQGESKLGQTGTLTAGAMVSMAAGFAVGATMAVNQANATLSVPRMRDGANNAKELVEGQFDNVPLFFAKKNDKPAFFVNPVAVEGEHPVQALANIATSIAYRSHEMLKATVVTGMVLAATPSVVKNARGHEIATTAIMFAAAIHGAIGPWFQAQTKGAPWGFPAGAPATGHAANDAAIKQRRQKRDLDPNTSAVAAAGAGSVSGERNSTAGELGSNQGDVESDDQGSVSGEGNSTAGKPVSNQGDVESDDQGSVSGEGNSTAGEPVADEGDVESGGQSSVSGGGNSTAGEPVADEGDVESDDQGSVSGEGSRA